MGSIHGLGHIFEELVRGEAINLVNDLPLGPYRFVWLVPT
jgi:hypothetical protein